MWNFGDDRLPPRFWNKVIPEPNSGCWLWVAARDHAGYGCFSVGSKALGTQRTPSAHRHAYEVLVGAAGDLQIDHLCRTPCCVNPAHLEAVTRLVNVRRGLKGVLTTHCPRGHAYEDANVWVRRTGPRAGRRSCRECGNARERAYSRGSRLEAK